MSTTTINFQIGDRIRYNDGRAGHDVGAKVLSVGATSMVVQFDDRADTTTIRYADEAWMKHIEPATMTTEQEQAKHNAIEMAQRGISELAHISVWFDQLNGFLVFHPDTDFENYIALPDGEETFTESEVFTLNTAMANAFEICDKAGVDIYELCIESAQRLGVMPRDTAATMIAAVALLADLGATFEHPGYIDITDGAHFAFGDANGDFGGDYGPVDNHWDSMRSDCKGSLPLSATPEQLAAFIREQIAETKRNG